MTSTADTPAISPSVPSVTVTCYVPVADRVIFPAGELAARLAALGETAAAAVAWKIARREPIDRGKHGEAYGWEGRADTDLDGPLADLASACERHSGALGLGTVYLHDALDAEDFRVEVEDDDAAPPAQSAAAAGSGPAQPGLPAGEAGTPGLPGREVVVVAPDGTEHRFTVSGGDADVKVLVDGELVLAVDQHGPGRWYGEEWRRMHPADSITARSVAIEGISTEEQWRDLEAALGLTRGHLGRFKPWAAGQPKILDARNYDLDAAVAWAREHGLAYEEEQRVRTDARPRP